MRTPPFYNTEINGNSNIQAVTSYFQKVDWITPELKNKIDKQFLTDNERTDDSKKGRIKYTKHSYSLKCEYHFLTGRVFFNVRKLYQTAEMIKLALSV